MSKLDSLLQIGNLSSTGRSLFLRYFGIVAATSTILLFSRTFYVLYVIDKLGLAAIATLFAISYGIQALVDYPTSNLQKKYGANSIYFTAMFLYSLVFFFFPLANSYLDFVWLFLIDGIARSQETGTLNSWFDLNYNKVVAEDDPNYKTYIGFNSSLLIVDSLLSIFMAVIGGFMATFLPSGRETVFIIQGFCLLILAIISYRTIIDFYHKPAEKEIQTSPKADLVYALKQPLILIFIVVFVIDWITSSIWMDLLMFPLIFGYTGSDFLSSVLILFVFLFAGVLIWLAGEIGKKALLAKWIPLSLLIQTLFTFGASLVLISIIEIKDEFNIIGCIALVFIISSAAFSISLFEILTKKFYIDTIPDDKRNSFYSLIPSISFISAAGMNYFAGTILNVYNLVVLITIIIGMRLIASILSYFSLKSYKQTITPEIIYRREIPYIFDRELKDVSKTFVYFKPSDWYLSETIKEIWIRLLDSAKEDEVITEDGINLLTQTMLNLNQYIELLETGLEDGKLTIKEVSSLEAKRLEILADVIRFAKKDGVIDISEMGIISKLQEVLGELSNIETATRVSDRV